MNLLLPDTGLLFWMVIIFALVFFLLAKFGFPVITRMVEERSDHIEKSLEAARKAEVQVSKLEERQAMIISQTRQEQGKIVEQASRTRDDIVARAREEARAEAGKILDQARRQLELEKETALREIRSQVAGLSVDIAEKILRRELEGPEEQSALVDKMFNEINSDHK